MTRRLPWAGIGHTSFIAAAVAGAVLMLSLAGTSSAFPPGGNGGGGKGGGGGEDPPAEPPPVEYQISASVALPFVGSKHLNDINETAGAAGSYSGESGLRAWIYEPGFDPDAFDPNDLGLPGIDPDDPGQWTMNSAIGINNNGLVVGRMSSNSDPDWSRGYVLDLVAVPPEIYDLPDLDWDDSYARTVNDNGDILGRIRDDNSSYQYLFSFESLTDPGAQLEVIDIPSTSLTSEITNPPPGTPASVVGQSTDNALYVYTQGGSLAWLEGFSSIRATISANGIIAGVGSFPKKGKQTENRMFRDTFGSLEKAEISVATVYAVNGDGTALFLDVATQGLWHTEYGLIALEALIPAGLAPDVYFGHQNESGVLGFTEIAGIANDSLIVLTPVSTEP